jgi:GR25 family glycosyltransferase involved in LPS biosynthesis
MKAYCVNLKERPERWVEFQTQKLPFEVERFEAIKATPGWVGCTRSYVEVMKKIDGPTLVMEDDCLFLESWEFVEGIMTQLPYNWDCLYLGATLNEPLEKFSENLYKLKRGWTTHAILYRDARIPEFIVRNAEMVRKIDVFLELEVQPRFNCFITYPLVATQRPGYSDIINREQDYAVIKERYDKYVI